MTKENLKNGPLEKELLLLEDLTTCTQKVNLIKGNKKSGLLVKEPQLSKDQIT